MRHAILLCAAGLLSGCISVHSEDKPRSATDARPSVSYRYDSLQEYRSAERAADEYCAERYSTDARPVRDYSATGGEATFVCD
jgi:hypothetical protein